MVEGPEAYPAANEYRLVGRGRNVERSELSWEVGGNDSERRWCGNEDWCWLDECGGDLGEGIVPICLLELNIKQRDSPFVTVSI